MEFVILLSIEMILVALAVIFFLCHVGYDLRSRGFDGTYAFTVIHQNEISMGDYFRKKDQHPVLDGQRENVKMSKLYLAICVVTILIAVCLPFVANSI